MSRASSSKQSFSLSRLSPYMANAYSKWAVLAARNKVSRCRGFRLIWLHTKKPLWMQTSNRLFWFIHARLNAYAQKKKFAFANFFSVAGTGFEPATPRVWTVCSSQLSYPATFNLQLYSVVSGTNRARTYDPLLVRQVLSQLSYDPILQSLSQPTSIIYTAFR